MAHGAHEVLRLGVAARVTHTGCPSHRIVLVTAAAACPERKQQYSLSPFALGWHADRQVGGWAGTQC